MQGKQQSKERRQQWKERRRRGSGSDSGSGRAGGRLLSRATGYVQARVLQCVRLDVRRV